MKNLKQYMKKGHENFCDDAPRFDDGLTDDSISL